MNYKSLFYEYIWNYYSKNVRQNQTYSAIRIYERFIDQYFGEMDISTITRKMIMTYISVLDFSTNPYTNSFFAPSLINKIEYIFNGVFKYALQKSYIDKIPYDRLRPKKIVNKKIRRGLTKREQYILEKEIINSFMEEPYHIACILSSYTGLRISEICALKWSDFCFEDQTIKVSRAQTKQYNFTMNKYTYNEEMTKTPSSNRTIYYPDYIVPLLVKYKRINHSEFFMVDKKGKRIMNNQYRYLFKKLLDRLGLKGITFHSLRHTFATRATESGMDIKSLQELLGHSKTSITRDIYIHISTEELFKEINAYNTQVH